MNWIDEAERETQASIERQRQIVEERERIFESLWQEVKSQIDDAKRIERFRAIFTNGGPLSRVVKLPVDNGTREIVFTLDKIDNRIITKRSGDLVIVFDIDICEDGFTCLKMRDEPITPGDAAKEALRPFLFVELYSRIPKLPINFRQ